MERGWKTPTRRTLEQHGHLHLSEQSCRILLSMSAATADRLLRPERLHGLKNLSTTKAGPLLKQQIPIRTFADWNETQPGFLEVALVAHCGSNLEGSFLYTLTLTDVATGWTECLPLRHRGREEVLAALQRARTLIPFPILGIDTDNGGEFINEEVAAYCAREQITFTRGRPYEKRDQCFIEQKNGVVVRQVVGRDRFEGEHAARQLTELSRALRLYVNCFQPSMKLLAKEYEGRKMRRVYDPARTPLQRLLLSGVLPDAQQHELKAVVRALDPLRLFQQLRRLQQAFFSCAVGHSLTGQATPTSPLLVFAAERCTTGLVLSQGTERARHRGITYSARLSGIIGEPLCARLAAHQQRSLRRAMRANLFLDASRSGPYHWRDLPRITGSVSRTLSTAAGPHAPTWDAQDQDASILTTREEQWQQELIRGKISTTQSQRKEPIVKHDASPPLPMTSHWEQRAPCHAHLTHQQKHRLCILREEVFVR